MLAMRSDSNVGTLPLLLCHILCFCVAWIQLAHARPQTGIHMSALIPSTPVRSQVDLEGLIPSAPSNLPIPTPPYQPSQTILPQTIPTPIASASSPVKQSPLPPIPSAPVTTGPKPTPLGSFTSNASFVSDTSRLGTTGTLGMTSTDQGLRSIPPAATQVGDPDGHHEITEPNFSATKPCRTCSPIFEVTVTGWLDGPPEDQHGVSTQPIQSRVPAGLSNVLISQAPSGGNFVIGGSTTVAPGQTITVNDVPVAIQTTGGTVEVIVGTKIIPLQPPEAHSDGKSRITYAPTRLPPVLNIGTKTIIANPQTQYVVLGQTLIPDGTAITIAGTTISLAPSATAVVINGVTSSMVPNFGNIWTKSAPAFTFHDHVYTANRAGYITISPGTVLKPGGEAIIVDGTVLSLDHSGTAVVIEGSTSILQPVTTVVTLTRSVEPGGVVDGHAGYTSGDSWSKSTNRPEAQPKPISAGTSLSTSYSGSDAWFNGLLTLMWWALRYLAVAM
ncbi:hypothetical protein BDU57DRAFT_498292 [Ampelomyces quisqualis]|uniref:Uncharacterized protein n=1 Tax=Ampelomyces quisqualis TaxID=50730 RepID=A0A6A5QNS5_AMPQU|nr:hypothetical protein BDU57DRAFT_498292 [Ampelomyces quisqualis]